MAPEHRAMNTRMAAGCSAGRIGLTSRHQTQMGVHVGGGIDPVSPHCSMSYSAEVDLQQTDGPYAL